MGSPRVQSINNSSNHCVLWIAFRSERTRDFGLLATLFSVTMALNDRGNYKLWRSVKGAEVLSVKRLSH